MNLSKLKQKDQSDDDEGTVVLKYAIQINSNCTKKFNINNKNNIDENFEKNNIEVISDNLWTKEDQQKSSSTFDSDKYFQSLFSELNNFDENEDQKLVGNDVLLSQTIKQERDDSTSGFNSEYSDSTEIIHDKENKYTHYLKYLSRGGKVTKIWECGICTRNFQHQYTLMRHLPTHSNVRNFVCNECGKAFRQLSTLTQHQAIHSIERPYVCETCKKSFNRISTLISHRKTHSTVKPFQCTLCGKGFHQKGNLRNHVYIHTNARPYRCPVCDKGFNQMSNLVCHTQKSHSGQSLAVWSCHRCNMSFSKRALLRAHELETHHSQSTHSSKSSRSRGATSKKNILQPLAETNQVQPPQQSNSKSKVFDNGILIPAIETDAMKMAKANNEIPFAVLHLIEGYPSLVRIIDYGNRSLLRAANVDDFNALKMNQNNGVGKVSIPVVAAVYQVLNTSGASDFTVLAPKNIYKFPNVNNIFQSNCPNNNNNNTTPRNGQSDINPLQNMIAMNTVTNVDDETAILMRDIIELTEPETLNENKPRAIAVVQNEPWWNNATQDDISEENDTYSETFQNIATGSLLSPKRVKKENLNTNETENVNNKNSNQQAQEQIDPEIINNFLASISTDEIENLFRSFLSGNLEMQENLNNSITEMQ